MKRKHTLKKWGAVGAMPPTHCLSKTRLHPSLEGATPQRGSQKKKRKWEAKLFNLSCPHAEGPQQKQEAALCVFEFP